MNPQEKVVMINKFVEVSYIHYTCLRISRTNAGLSQTIPIHQEAARRTSTRFHELGKQVEVFPMKVSSYLRQQADQGSWLTALWSGVEE